MGCILNILQNASLLEESRVTIQHKTEYIQKLLTNASVLESQLTDLSYRLAQAEKTIYVCERYDSLIQNQEETASLIMKSNLHLEYMDDAVEKRYICDLLGWIYTRVNV
jgi:hypothetical protein